MTDLIKLADEYVNLHDMLETKKKELLAIQNEREKWDKRIKDLLAVFKDAVGNNVPMKVIPVDERAVVIIKQKDNIDVSIVKMTRK